MPDPIPTPPTEPAGVAEARKSLDTIPNLPLYREAFGKSLPRSKVYMDDHGDGRFVAETNDLRGEYGAFFTDATIHLRATLAHVVHLTAEIARVEGERDAARDETSRLWDATEADRAKMGELLARIAELETRPTYEQGVYAAIDVMEAAAVDSPDSVFFAVTAICPRILALLEPKT